MRRNLVRSALIGSLLSAALPVAAFAADGPDGRVQVAATGTLEICISANDDDGIGQFSVEAISEDINYLTPLLNGSAPGTTCWTQVTEEDTYQITPGKYLSANCLQTANGHPVNPPAHTTDRCQAKVHHWHVVHDTDNDNVATPGPESTIEVPEVLVTVIPGETTRVFAHVVDIRYPECTETAEPNRVCEPDPGPTTS